MSLQLYLAFIAACIALALLPGPVVTLLIANGLRHGTRAALIDAAKKEGQVIHYTSTDLPVAEKLARAFEAKYPGIAVRVERTGVWYGPGSAERHEECRTASGKRSLVVPLALHASIIKLRAHAAALSPKP